MKKGWMFFFSLFTLLLGISGCGKEQPPIPMDPVRLPSSELAELSYTCNHMDRMFGFRFSLKEGEQGQTLLDARWGDPDTDQLTELEAVEVPSAVMEDLRQLVEEEQLTACLCRPEEAGDNGAVDQTSYILTARWKDGTMLSISEGQPVSAALEVFFRNLASEHGTIK